MRETTVSVYRPEGTLLASGIRVQVDQLSDQEMVELAGFYDWRGVDRFRIYTLDWNPTTLIARGDLLVDERFTDEATSGGQYFRYRVVSRPKTFDRSYQAMLCDVTVGQ